MEEVPKNYSDFYRDDAPPKPAFRGSTSAGTRHLDGESQWRRKRETLTAGGIDWNELLPKLDTLSREQHKLNADRELRKHYTDVFQNRAVTKPRYKVGIEYVEHNGQRPDRYLVKVERNTLEQVRAKLPIKGNYRLFFSHASNECEEIEDDEAQLPVQTRNDELYIHCRVFKR